MKRILALLLCLVMVFSLAACGGNEKPNDTKPGTSESGDKTPTENVGDTDGDIDEKPVETIRPNGELPNNERDIAFDEE